MITIDGCGWRGVGGVCGWEGEKLGSGLYIYLLYVL